MTHSYPVADAAGKLVRSRDKMNVVRWFVVFEGSILGSAVSVFSFLKLPFMHKTEVECIPQSIRHAEFDSSCFLLLVLLLSGF